MAVLSISLPDDVREWAEKEAAARGASLDDLFSRMARDARNRQQEDFAARESRLETSLLNALDSGHGDLVTSQWWEEFRSELETELEGQHGDRRFPE